MGWEKYDAAGNRKVVGLGGGSGYSTVEEDGSAVTVRSTVNFRKGFDVADVSSKTAVDIDDLEIANDAWASWSPALTNATSALGNGILVGKYKRIGRVVFWRLYFELGSTTNAGTGPLTISLPATVYNDSTGYFTVVGAIWFWDNSANFYTGVALATENATGTGFMVSGNTNQWLDKTHPVTMATADRIAAGGSYEAAS